MVSPKCESSLERRANCTERQHQDEKPCDGLKDGRGRSEGDGVGGYFLMSRTFVIRRGEYFSSWRYPLLQMGIILIRTELFGAINLEAQLVC